jgi:hypothetical protein
MRFAEMRNDEDPFLEFTKIIARTAAYFPSATRTARVALPRSPHLAIVRPPVAYNLEIEV